MTLSTFTGRTIEECGIIKGYVWNTFRSAVKSNLLGVQSGDLLQLKCVEHISIRLQGCFAAVSRHMLYDPAGYVAESLLAT